MTEGLGRNRVYFHAEKRTVHARRLDFSQKRRYFVFSDRIPDDRVYRKFFENRSR